MPSDHSDYHVIVAVWSVYDTKNDFYQASDVSVKGEGEINKDAKSTCSSAKINYKSYSI